MTAREQSAEVNGTSQLIPLKCDLVTPTNLLIAHVESSGVAVKQNATHDGFPNSRGNIEYELLQEPYAIVLGDTVQQGNALRYLFFVAHGFGHFQQYTEGKHDLAAIIHEASSFGQQRSMDDIVDVRGTPTRFGDFFNAFETEASQYGWQAVQVACAPSYDVRFWYELYGLADREFHTRTITGDLPEDPASWLPVAGKSLQSVLRPFRGESGPEFIYVGDDGAFHKAGQEMRAKVGHARQFFENGGYVLTTAPSKSS
ncbi:MAG: hypothetical protein OXR66_04345 [Candidatus Woesearchaeota archaeon]|nr:hypothetical protein [Candidatus Woesearchaeota archaeon]